MKKALRSQWIAPMDAPIIRDGAVVFLDGRILAVGSARDVLNAHPDAQVADLGDSVVLPGLINAHTHLELSDRTPGDSPPGDFADWIVSLRAEEEASPADATAAGIAQCLRFGVTCIGDVSQKMQITRPLIAKSPLRAVSYGEVLGMAQRRARLDELLPHAIDPTDANDRLRIGLQPHAPYTVELSGYRRCLEIARQRSMPLATHLAENPDETEFLKSHSGMFRGLWDRLGWWFDSVETYPGSPIAMAQAIGMLDYPTLLAHVNYCDDSDLAMLAAGQASVVYCPRTHRYFGHPPHRWCEMMARGINVAIGTDSCASSPDLNIVDDLRLVHAIAPEISAQSLWEMVTIRGARALGMENEIGSITPNKRADFTVFRVSTDGPLQEVLDSAVLPSSTWINEEQCH